MNRCSLIALPLFLVFAAAGYTAEKTPWLIDIDGNVTVTQNAYSESWSGSELGALSWASKLNIIAERQFATWFSHRNTLKLAYGQTKTQKEDGDWNDFAKSADLIDFESLQKFTLDKLVEPFVAVRLLSFFTDERDALPGGKVQQRHYANTLDLFESFGVARSLLTSDATKWNARLGGSVHQSIDRFPELSAVPRDDKLINDAGLEFVTELKAKMRDGLLDYSLLFTLYEALATSLEDAAVVTSSSGTPTWRYPDINWENILSVNLTKYVMVNLTVQLLYDRDMHANARIKEVLALGLTYKFNNAKKEAK